jgi:hypothetical protein
MKKSLEKLNFVSPAEYKISVLGFLDENMTDRLGGLTIESQEPGPDCNKSKITLTGILPDQAALFGVLNILYNMRLLLLSVEYLGEY